MYLYLMCIHVSVSTLVISSVGIPITILIVHFCKKTQKTGHLKKIISESDKETPNFLPDDP